MEGGRGEEKKGEREGGRGEKKNELKNTFFLRIKKKEKRGHLTSNLELPTLGQVIIQVSRSQRESEQPERILSALRQFLEVPSFLLDSCSPL